jgi:hypothetical protein
MYMYALAVSGGAVAYMPFLTILLPLRATDISGTDADSGVSGRYCRKRGQYRLWMGQ